MSVHDCVYYLRAESPADRQKWLDMLDATKVPLYWLCEQKESR